MTADDYHFEMSEDGGLELSEHHADTLIQLTPAMTRLLYAYLARRLGPLTDDRLP